MVMVPIEQRVKSLLILCIVTRQFILAYWTFICCCFVIKLFSLDEKKKSFIEALRLIKRLLNKLECLISTEDIKMFLQKTDWFTPCKSVNRPLRLSSARFFFPPSSE